MENSDNWQATMINQWTYKRWSMPTGETPDADKTITPPAQGEAHKDWESEGGTIKLPKPAPGALPPAKIPL